MKEFKVGDMVRCIGKGDGYWGSGTYRGCGWKKGRVFIIDYLNGSIDPPYFAKDGDGVYGKWLEKIGDTLYEVGDWIEIKKDGLWCAGVKKGELVQVIEVYSDGIMRIKKSDGVTYTFITYIEACIKYIKKLPKTEGKEMAKTELKKGDRVKRISGGFQKTHVGDTDTVKDVNTGWSAMLLNLKKYGEGHDPKMVIKIDSPSKYDELKSRIIALENGWDKEADDIIQEMHTIEQTFGPALEVKMNCGVTAGNMVVSHLASNKCSQFFKFGSQCEKMGAFRKALIWMLDKSGIKNSEKQDKIDTIQSQINELQREVKELRS